MFISPLASSQQKVRMLGLMGLPIIYWFIINNRTLKFWILKTSYGVPVLKIIRISSSNVQFESKWSRAPFGEYEFTGREVKLMASFTNSGSQAISTWVAPPCRYDNMIIWAISLGGQWLSTKRNKKHMQIALW